MTTGTTNGVAAETAAQNGFVDASKPKETFRKDYLPTLFSIAKVDLHFDLNDPDTIVTSQLKLHRSADANSDLVLNGEELELMEISVNGNELTSSKDYFIEGNTLRISSTVLPSGVGEPFTLKTRVKIHPKENLQLSGLYQTNNIFSTQCEAEGFRRITYFLDRPDVMSMFTVRLEADAEKYPVLLSNGNLIESGSVEGAAGRHFAVYEDPHKKPCYLFALVAGDLKSISDKYVTMSNRPVKIEIFSEASNVKKLDWAMDSVKKAMKWDEVTFGLEYDLDVFNVVCVNDFNMGAMENKGLNIFNCKLLVADPQVTTDAEYERIMNVVGHEYFHNWTGNRVTCRDWFQLTLKEGLTVFRDQIFSADMCSASVKRIEDVISLKSRQFAEDEGPMSHPIRPEAYIAMDNFYTATVYEKGAEVIRMYYTLLGKEGFRKGMDLYFKRHDGQAVTCDDFRAAMADANNRDLTQFERWYSQAGTPSLEVKSATYSADKKEFTLCLKQSTPPTPGQDTKLPFHMPISIGLIGKESHKDLLSPSTMVLEMTENEQTFTIPNVSEDCVLSILRGFSAPVKLVYPRSDSDIAFLMAYDSDDVSKWQAAQQIATKILLDTARKISHNEPIPAVSTEFLNAIKNTLVTDADKSIKALTIRLPNMHTVAQDMQPYLDPDALMKAYEHLRTSIYSEFEESSSNSNSTLSSMYNELRTSGLHHEKNDAFQDFQPEYIARRRLCHALLYYQTALKDKAAAEIAYHHYKEAKSMTERYTALSLLVDMSHPQRETALQDFYDRANGDPLVIDKWFTVQAMANVPDAFERVVALKSHPDFIMTSPNRMRSLIMGFTNNMVHFHRKDGKGYEFIANIVLELDKFNPQVSARVVGSLLNWHKMDSDRQVLMRTQLERIRSANGLSNDTLEIVQKALEAKAVCSK